MDKLRNLIRNGYFPIQLPPAFSSESFSQALPKIKPIWDKSKYIPTRAEKYSVARSSYFRRITSIVNPIGYYFIANEITRHWRKIERHYRKSKISLSKPKIEPNIRAIKISKFSELYEAKIERSSGYKYALITDITGFFPSIYTHSIPWALHTKDIAKKNQTKTDEYFGNCIDGKSMGLQDRQTMGIPIGPDTSHIISELIGTAIDKELFDALGHWPAGFRYVDDFYLFFNTRDDAEKVLALLTKIINSYELQINASKTKIIEVKELVEESWKYNIKKLSISHERQSQRNDIHNYFEVIFKLEQKFKDESIIKYALKQICSSVIKKSNWSIFEAYLFKCGYGFPNTLQVITNILSTYYNLNYKINKKAVERFCNNLIMSHAIADHHGEVSWLLWLCKEVNVKIKREAVREVEQMSSSVCKLIILDLYHSKIIKHSILTDNLKYICKKESLYSPDWLITYEAGRRFWLKNKNINFIKESDFFKDLLDNDVYFYNEYLKIKPVFDLKNKEGKFEDIDDIFDNDEDISNHFIFDEIDDEYFDESSDEKNSSPDGLPWE